MNIFEYPRLLTITINAWADNNSTGNTISNHFGDWDSEKVSNVFLRNEEIDNTVCSSYYRICEKDIISSFFSKKRLGIRIIGKPQKNGKASLKPTSVSKIKSFLIRIRPTLILILREFFWLIGFRKTENLDLFLDENKPEVIHMHCPTLIYPHRVLKYCHQKTKAKVVLFFGDELYSHKKYWPLTYVYQLWLRYWVRKSLKFSNLNYAATPELCNYYTRIFKKEFKVLYKGAEIKIPEKQDYNTPIKIVYAGNLLYGRWQVLALLEKAIHQVSNGEKQFQLDIYTATPLTTKMNRALNTTYASVLGVRSFSEIKTIMSSADIVLHVESFESDNIKLTKYSFSTKIIDCIQSGSCVLGIGPSELSSINFLKESNAALVCNSYSEIVSSLCRVIENKSLILDNGKKMYAYSKDIFDLKEIRRKLQSDILKMLNTGSL